MSGTANEFDEPGGNYPDRRDEETVEPSGEQLRSDAGQGGAIAEEEAPSAEPLQTAPLMDVDSPTVSDQLAGLVAQTRADLGPKTRAEVKAQKRGELADPDVDRAEEILRQRLNDAGIDIPDERVRALAAEVIGQ